MGQFERLLGPFGEHPFAGWSQRAASGSPFDLAAFRLLGTAGIVTQNGNELVSWSGDGLTPAVFVPNSGSTIMNVDSGVVSANGNGYLSWIILVGEGQPTTHDMSLGVSIYVVCKVPDASVAIPGNRLFWTRSSTGSSRLNAFFPSAANTVQLATLSGNLSASGLSNADLETEAVWGFIYDTANSEARILRNGVTLASMAATVPITDAANHRILNASHAQVRDAVTFGFGSPELDAAATAALMAQYGIS